MLLKFQVLTLVIVTGSVLAQASDVATDFFQPVQRSQPVQPVQSQQKSQLSPEQLIKTYGPVPDNETMWDIADKLRMDESITIVQMAVALFLKNPDVFINNNINGLLSDVTLSVPDKKQVLQLSKLEAESIFQQHWQNWQNHVFQSEDVVEVEDEVVDQTASIQINNPESEPEYEHKAQPDDLEKSSKVIPLEPQISITTKTKGQLSDSAPVVNNNKENKYVENKILSEITEQKSVESILKDSHSATEKNNMFEHNTSLIVTDDNTKIPISTNKNSHKFELPDELSQVEFQLVSNDIVHDITKTISLFLRSVQSHIKNNTSQLSFIGSPENIISIVFFVFFLWWFFFRKQQVDYTVIKHVELESEFEIKSEKAALLEPAIESKLSEINKPAIKNYLEIEASVNDEHHVTGDATKNDEKRPLITGDISNEMDINEFLSTPQIKSHKNGSGILEKAFDNKNFLSETSYIPEKSEQNEQKQVYNQEQSSVTAEKLNLLDSIEEIKDIQDTIRASKIDAFLNATQFEKNLLASETPLKSGELSVESSVDEMLVSEFNKIIKNEKVDVFIEEFELLVSSLTQQIPILEKAPNGIENLIQFKLSIHFIKVLSEMIQANQLDQFSQTVIGFLDDIVDGNTKMNIDIFRRLSFVVNFYDRYINSVKQNLSVKLGE